MDQSHPQVVIKKARRLEQLLQQVEQGEPLAEVCAELGLEVSPERLTTLQAKYEAEERSWEALIDGRYGHQQSLTSEMKEWLYERKGEDERLSGPELVKELAERFKVKISVGHVNHMLRQVSLSWQTGRPPKAGRKKEGEAEKTAGPVVDNAGIFFPGGSQSGDGGGRSGDPECGNGPSGVSRGQPEGIVAAADQFEGNDLE
jgi:transposase